MNQRIIEWLNSPSSQEGRTTLERLAELVAVNGGVQVNGYGFISSGGPYGRNGLEQDEAFELMHFAGMLHAFQLSFDYGGFDNWILPQLKVEWEKDKARMDAELEKMKAGDHG